MRSATFLLLALLSLYSIRAWQLQSPPPPNNKSRRQALIQTVTTMVAAGASLRANPALATDDGLPVLQTPSGLKYLDLQEGTGPSPSYGDMVTIGYKGYIKFPESNNKQYPTKPQLFDRTDAFLFKHGSGRMIAGLDEGLHTMKEGGTRRILIPPKLGFVDIGLGPLPVLPWNRNKLIALLDQMVEVGGGTLVYEVTLNGVYQDEADQGYYTDSSLTPEEFNTLRTNMQRQGLQKRIEEDEEEARAAASSK